MKIMFRKTFFFGNLDHYPSKEFPKEFIEFTPSLVPEPDRQWMFAVAVASLAALRRRRETAGGRNRA